MQERINGASEVAVGGLVATIPVWGKILDDILVGAHLVAALCGAIIALHGVWRIMRGKPMMPRVRRTREEDGA